MLLLCNRENTGKHPAGEYTVRLRTEGHIWLQGSTDMNKSNVTALTIKEKVGCVPEYFVWTLNILFYEAIL